MPIVLKLRILKYWNKFRFEHIIRVKFFDISFRKWCLPTLKIVFIFALLSPPT